MAISVPGAGVLVRLVKVPQSSAAGLIGPVGVVQPGSTATTPLLYPSEDITLLGGTVLIDSLGGINETVFDMFIDTIDQSQGTNWVYAVQILAFNDGTQNQPHVYRRSLAVMVLQK